MLNELAETMPKPWGIDFGKKRTPGEIVLPRGRIDK
jgi:hypothetical protein